MINEKRLIITFSLLSLVTFSYFSLGWFTIGVTLNEEAIISMYANRMSVREIYGMDLSPQSISNITDRILPLIEEWKNRSLEEVYGIEYGREDLIG